MDLKEKQRLLDDHFSYEINMLKGTYVKIGEDEDPIVGNALIESFCIHARQLLEFYENKQGIKVKDFIDGSFNLMHIISLAKKSKMKLNTQIAHLTEARTADQNEKLSGSECTELCEKILLESANFQLHLLSDLQMPKLDFAMPLRPTPVRGDTGPNGPVKVTRPSATNAIQST